MIERYPHTIAFQCQGPAAPGLDENGNPVEVIPVWSDVERCRYESDGRSNIQVLPDGSVKTYAFVVFMERPIGDTAGRIAKLFDSRGNVVCEGVVHHSPDYQSHSEIFIEKCL